MLQAILLVLVIAVALVLIMAASKPATFKYTRSTRIRARPETIFPMVNDFHRWTSWSPYEKLDPSLERTYSGAASGKGAQYAWQGNAKAGAGTMTISDTTQDALIVIQLAFSKPFKANNVAQFSFSSAEAQSDSTEVSWSMSGRALFIAKVMQIFVDMDKMIGKDFEIGLENLKRISESA
jgi:hypothetical protein